MPSPVETILTSAGIPQEEVSSIVSMSPEDAEKFDATPYLEKVKTNYKTQLENDPDFFSGLTLEKLPPDIKKKLESSQYGRAANITRDKLLKGLGFTEADLADMSDEQKEKLELFVPAIADKFTKTKAGDKQLQQDLIEARKKLEGFDGIEEKIKTKYESQAEAKITDALFNANLIGELSTIPGLKVKASTLAREAKEILLSKYATERVGDVAVELRQKANPQMKVLKEGSSHELTLKDALLQIAESEGWVEKETSKQNGSGKVSVLPTNDGLKAFVPPHLQDKIGNKIAANGSK